jgi:hypothetical protein
MPEEKPPGFVILSAAKDLSHSELPPVKILRCAQDDNKKALRMTIKALRMTIKKNPEYIGWE